MEKQLATGFANAISSSFSPYASLWPDRLAWQLQWAARRLDSLAHPKISKTIGRPNVLKKGVVQGLCGGCAGISEPGDPLGSAGFLFGHPSCTLRLPVGREFQRNYDGVRIIALHWSWQAQSSDPQI